MSGQAKGSKRARNEDQQDGAGVLNTKTGREQLLLTAPDLQTRLGRKFVDESDLLTLLIAHGLVRRVRTIQIEVRPLGGDKKAGQQVMMRLDGWLAAMALPEELATSNKRGGCHCQGQLLAKQCLGGCSNPGSR
jgi:hypothetical protein